VRRGRVGRGGCPSRRRGWRPLGRRRLIRVRIFAGATIAPEYDLQVLDVDIAVRIHRRLEIELPDVVKRTYERVEAPGHHLLVNDVYQTISVHIAFQSADDDARVADEANADRRSHDVGESHGSRHVIQQELDAVRCRRAKLQVWQRRDG
jgi:hypothetical protein